MHVSAKGTVREMRLELPGMNWVPPPAPMIVVPFARVSLNAVVGGKRPCKRALTELIMTLPSPAASARTSSWSNSATGKEIFLIAEGDEGSIYVF